MKLTTAAVIPHTALYKLYVIIVLIAVDGTILDAILISHLSWLNDSPLN